MSFTVVRGILFRIVCAFLLGCSVDFKSSTAGEARPREPLTAEQHVSAKENPTDPNEVMEDWFFGQGLGEAVLNVAGVVLFPPYGLYVLGNGVAQAFGYEPLSIGDALPQDVGSAYKAGYDEVSEAPGRVTAALGGREFRSKEAIESRNRSAGDARGTTDQESGHNS